MLRIFDGKVHNHHVVHEELKIFFSLPASEMILPEGVLITAFLDLRFPEEMEHNVASAIVGRISWKLTRVS